MSRNWSKCICGEEGCEYVEDVFYWHELLHTSYLALDFFAGNVEGHWVSAHNEELKEAAEKVTYAMYNFYQLVAERYDDFEENNER